MSLLRKSVVVLAVGIILASNANADALQEGFTNPPNSARPRVWWHWMNGNVTKDGIAKDLDWMQRVGIGGLQSFDVNLLAAQIVEKRLVYMSPQWKDAFRFAAELADQKGLELAIAASPGWSETGGPWVTPQDGMKKIVWNSITVTGGKSFTTKLPSPPQITGPYQDLGLLDEMSNLSGSQEKAQPHYYADIAVLAYSLSDPSNRPANAIFAAADGKPLEGRILTDERFSESVTLPHATQDQPQIVTIRYDKPRTIRAATIFVPGAVGAFTSSGLSPRLEARDGAGIWNKVADITLGTVPTTVAFFAVTAKEFRVVLAQGNAKNPLGSKRPAPGADVSLLAAAIGPPLPQLKLAELNLSSEPRVDQPETKAGFSVTADYYAISSAAASDDVGPSPDAVIDLTSGFKPDGTLEWTAPRGRWRIVRIGWSLTGKTNHPAAPEATGLEVDKLDGDAVRRYLEHYVGTYKEALGSDLMGAKGLRALLTDSTEVGAFNWTPKMLEQFHRLRGYDAKPWLPVLTGALIGSRAQSDAFLYDYRQTIADLHASEHYGTVAKVAHEHGLKVYGEALEGERVSLGDDIDMRRFADYPMAALWTYDPQEGPQPAYLADMKGAGSTAHLFGQNIVAAESMTSMLAPWAHAPAHLRRVIDLEFACGINRPVIHTSVHQPLDDRLPGMALMIYGQYFNRLDTWAEFAKPWVDYISRNSFLLQQGVNVADVAYFYGEEAPLVGLYKNQAVEDAPKRYAYDFVNAGALELLSVSNGDLVAKSGAQYKVLYLGGSSKRMTLGTLRRITELVEAGATLVGQAPESSPSLKDDRQSFDALIRTLWDGQALTHVGKGKVIPSNAIETVLESAGVPPDFSHSGAADTDLMFVHRRLEDGELYYLNNRKARAASVELRFRVAGKQPELWRADTGKTEPVSYRIEGNVTIVPLTIASEDSFFISFRTPASASAMDVPKIKQESIAELAGPWKVAFQPERGAPASVHWEKLASLTESTDSGIKYFSGIATYTKSFKLPKRVRPGGTLMLDLGQIGDVAEVRVNGKVAGSAWHEPYQVDIGQVVSSGTNQLEIRVANRWVNRLIGDAQPEAKQPGVKKFTWTDVPTYVATAPLQPAGLIGPVKLLVERTGSRAVAW